jgi:hypothetical protein
VHSVASTIGFQDLSVELQQEVMELQKRMRVELQPLVLESTLTMQKVLECEDHTARLRLVRSFVEAEIKRLLTKKTIQGMFSNSSTRDSKPSAASTEQASAPSPSSSTSSIALDDDAFQ